MVIIPDTIFPMHERHLTRIKSRFAEKDLEMAALPADSCPVNLEPLNQNPKFRFILQKDFPEEHELWERPAQFPFAGMVGFSPILFDQSGNYGFLHGGYMRGQLCGKTVDVFIQKEGEEWKVVEMETVGVF